ncbi:MAG: hypothetical protein QF464_18110 [Myxococcota bacterium]|nr:hypothetical protein [Myxococcota bacterium]
MMLLVALLVLLALTSVGMTSVHLVNSEMNFAGNSRRGASAFRVTESGAFAALAYTSSLGAETFATRVETEKALQPDGSTKTVWKPTDMVSGVSYFDLTESGSFGYEGTVLTDLAAAGDSPVDFEVRITETGMRQPLAGYSFTGPGSRCRFKYQIDTVGNVGVAIAGESEEASQSVWQMIRNTVYVGPLPCERKAAGLGAI